MLLAAALLAARTFMREFQRVAERRAQSRGVLSSPIPMPALGGVASWLGAPAGAPAPGTPMALVIFSTTDPGAGELLAEAEAWHDAYATHGVRVIGLHRPAFAFAADTARLVRALQRLGVSFPVAHDPSFAVPLPRFQGTTILVGEANGPAVAIQTRAEASAADLWLRARYSGRAIPLPRPPHERLPLRALLRLGAGQVRRGPLANAAPEQPATFVTQTRAEEEGRSWVPVPVGRWTPRAGGLESTRGGAANFLAIRYHAARVGVVVSPPAGTRARIWILRDDAWVAGNVRGRDLEVATDGATFVDVDEPRLLVPIEKDSGWHVLKLSPDIPGVELHALTFDGP